MCKALLESQTIAEDLNKLFEQGYSIVQTYQTHQGLVFILCK